MAESSWPSPNHNSRSVTDAEYGHLAPWASDGVFQSASDVVYANSSGLQVFVRSGKRGLVQGHAWYSGSSDVALTIAENRAGSTRIDTVVLQLDRSTWDVRAAVRQGTAGAGAPALQRDTGDTGLWEIPLADVTVDSGAASIASGKVYNRPLLQSGGVRACNVITDVQSLLAPGDIVYEASTGRWIGWTSGGGTVLRQDTGWTTLTPIGYWKTYTSSLPCVGRVLNGMVTLRIGVQRTTNTFTRSDPDGSPVLTLPSSLRPASSQYGAVFFSGGIGGARVEVNSGSGVLSFQHNDTDVAVGRTAFFTITYPVD
jgi:hypothetical protein